MQVPSPGYSGTQGELDAESFDFDLFEYWMDLNYGDDEYWDEEGARVTTKGVKRKRDGILKNPQQQATKRRKIAAENIGLDPVSFKPLAERMGSARHGPTSLPESRPFALLPDWRQRYAEDSGKLVEKNMPVEMKKAAEGEDLVTPPRKRTAQLVAAEEEDEEISGDQDGDADDALEQSASLDPDMLKAILKQRLGDAGLGGMDEEAFMQTIAKMMSGEEGAEDALADSLLSKAADGNDEVLSGWLSQQGVVLGDGVDDDDDGEETRANAQVRYTGDESTPRNERVSPKDSALGSSQNTALEQGVASFTPSPSKKRAAPKEGAESEKKRRADLVHPPVNGAVLDEHVTGVQREYLRETNSVVMEDKRAEVTHREKENGGLNGSNRQLPIGNSAGSGSTQDPPYLQEAKDEVKVSSLPARRTRKRKADGDVDRDETGNAEQRPKQAKKSNTVTEGSATPIGKRTRSARAKSGK